MSRPTDGLRAAVVTTVLLLAALLVITAPAGGASSGITVTASIPSSIALTNSCTNTAAWAFGTVIPGTSVTTTRGANVCRLDWVSTNDTGMLLISQKDGTAPAMQGSSGTWVDQMTSNRYMSAAASGPTTAWITMDWNTMYRTTNSGASWSSVPGPGSGTGYNDQLDAASTTQLWAMVGGGPTLYRTTNADTAVTWNAVGGIPAFTGRPKVAAVPGTNAAWLGSDTNYIAYTANGGGAWATQSNFVPASPGSNVDAIDSPANNIGWVSFENGMVYVTINAGGTWTRTTNAPGGSPDSLSAADSNIAYVVNDNGTIAATSDRGATAWRVRTMPGFAFERVASVSAVPGTNTAYAAGWYGHVWRTNDAGNTWSLLPTTSTTDLIDVAAGDATHAYIGAGSYQIVQTTDGANVTEPLEASNQDDINGVSAVDGNIAYAVGSDNHIFRTTNAGATWPVVATATNPLWDVEAADATHAWAVGEAGEIRHTTDGTTWNVQASGFPAAHLFAATSVSTSVAWVVGSGGLILKTTDGGATWLQQASGVPDDLHAVDAYDLGTVYASGDNGKVLKTTNGGATWTPLVTGDADRYWSLSVVSPTTVWMTSVNPTNGDWDAVKRTTNGGAAWTTIHTGLGWPDTINAIDDNVAWAAGDQYGALGKTLDGGATWSYQGWGGAWRSIAMVDRNVVWAASSNGHIARQSAAGSLSDYGGGNTWGGAPATSMFGMCVQDVGLSAAVQAPFVEDTTTTPGDCQPTDADPWAAIPTAPTKVAQTSLAGQSGRVDLVWGMRPATSQPPGTYSATVLLTALAPAV